MLKEVKFGELPVGTEFYQNPQATVLDRKIEPVQKIILCNVVGVEDGIYAFLRDDRTVCIKET